jgi:hypothetical protein
MRIRDSRHTLKQRQDVDTRNKSGHDVEKSEQPKNIVMAALVAAIHESAFQPKSDSRDRVWRDDDHHR